MIKELAFTQARLKFQLLFGSIAVNFVTEAGFDASPNGLHDVYGNVWECCTENASRLYLESGEGFSSPDTVIAHEEGTGRILSKFPLNSGVIRGGGYQSHLIWARSSSRYPFEINKIDHDTGFRVARPLILPDENER